MKYLLLILAIVLLSCNKDPIFENSPHIEFVSLSPSTAKHFSQDSVLITLKYQDGDGDIGSDQKENHFLFLKDNRELPDSIPKITPYNVPNLTPETKNPSIQGTIQIQASQFVLSRRNDPSLNSETYTYTIYMKDRAGHISNEVTTSPITIVR